MLKKEVKILVALGELKKEKKKTFSNDDDDDDDGDDYCTGTGSDGNWQL
jgi:hypothetical protein